MKTVIFAVLMALLVTISGVIGGCSSATPAGTAGGQKTITQAMGALSSSNESYGYGVALARAINKANVGINVTVVETGGGYDNLNGMKDGYFDWGGLVSYGPALECYYGLETFKGVPWEGIRLLWIRHPMCLRPMVRKDMVEKFNIKTWADLAGKKFSPGGVGSSVTMATTNFNNVLGTGVDLIKGSQGEVRQAVKDGRSIGIMAYSAPQLFPGDIMEIHYATPLVMIPFSKQDMEKIVARYPEFTIGQTPAGTIQGFPDPGPLTEITTVTGSVASTKISQDIGYRMAKAVCENWKELGIAYPPSAPWHPLKDYFIRIPKHPTVKPVPFHAGVIQYAKEVGLEVQPEIIPPEYKGSK